MYCHISKKHRKKNSWKGAQDSYINLVLKGKRDNLSSTLDFSGPLSSQALSISKDGDPSTSLGPVPALQHSYKEDFFPHVLQDATGNDFLSFCHCNVR